MLKIEDKGFIRNNENLKAPDFTELVTENIFHQRVEEIARCKNDIIYFAEKYFTIVSPGKGEHIIKLYDKQKELLKHFIDNDRTVVLASRQTGKTTTYTIFTLWLMCFHKDKKILICANTADASYEFVNRINFAYELLPNWLKPGVVKFNSSTLSLANGSLVKGTSTSPSSARGKACNVLICDEFAFVPPNICKDFWSSVYPVISSAKGTKVIMVSTPNGTGNMYYDIWNRAKLGIDDSEGLGWKPFQMNWDDVPERDEKWYRQTLESLNGDMRQFSQEFLNKFLGSSFTLIPGDVIEQLKKLKAENECSPKKKTVKGLEHFEYNEYYEPQANRSYILGGDIADGIGSDYSTAIVLDVTDLRDCKTVATFRHNFISRNEFAYLLTILGLRYNYCPIAIENNGVGSSVLHTLWYFYEYENILNYGTKNAQIGIQSHNSVKVNACLWAKELLEKKFLKFLFHNGYLLEEIEYFEKKVPSQMLVYKAVEGKHDDMMMALIWAIFLLHEENIENFFDIINSTIDQTGKTIPISLSSYDSDYYNEEGLYNMIGSSKINNNEKEQETYNKFMKMQKKETTSSDFEKQENINNNEQETLFPMFVGDEFNNFNDEDVWI